MVSHNNRRYYYYFVVIFTRLSLLLNRSCARPRLFVFALHCGIVG